MAPKTDYPTQLKELKDLIETTNTNIKLLENRITKNHKELMARICNVETQAKEALDLAKKNEIIINEVLEKQQETNDDLKLDLSKRVTTQIKEDLHINKIEAQLRGVLLELKDLRNQSMRSNLIFKGIPEESKETWDDTSQLLAGFIIENLHLPYSFYQMDMQIRTNDNDSSRRNNKSEPRPIIAQFVNKRVAEEVRQKIIHLNSRNQLKVIVNQMFSKELTERRNNALIKRKEYLRLHPDLQIKLDYPATMKSRRKGQNKWLILEEF